MKLDIYTADGPVLPYRAEFVWIEEEDASQRKRMSRSDYVVLVHQIEQWCRENIGRENWQCLCYYGGRHECPVFAFETKESLFHFKLRWG